jgi:hypothetical protein
MRHVSLLATDAAVSSKPCFLRRFHLPCMGKLKQNGAMRLLPILLLILSAIWPLAAKADIDQRCLNLCIANGESGTTCLPKCTYNESHSKQHSNAIPNAAATQAPDPHNVFTAPKPTDGEIIMPQHTAKKNNASKDYICINQCLQQGGQFDLCNKSCTRTDCPPGDARCTDLLGNVTSAMPSNNSSPGPTTAH